MLGFLDVLGTLGGNILGLPGIVGLALGMATRNWILAALLGGGIGLVDVFTFGGMRPGHITMTEIVLALLVGAGAGLLGCAIRRRGATV